ncbi:MAG: CDP-diacylglycerol--glycerol-3-phosphate 3-phosphatidyltransferase [SAR86 cluster bacterium]|nr:CDP-diacylglycerol--glycerol-3-phosphate 3-phosphatidyltransferase [SAR86 cluster bacterium]
MSLSRIPNTLSIFRILVIPIIIYISSLNWIYANYMATFLFLLASLSDYLDGYLARKLSLTSRLGGLLDLLADKLLITCCLIWLASAHNEFNILLPVIIIISRELVISSIREYLARLNLSNRLKVNKLGKIKTGFQMVSTSILFFTLGIESTLKEIGIFLLWITSILSIFSMLAYLKGLNISDEN